MNKTTRQNKIIEIINSKEIDTQEELVLELNAYNFNVTQATVSRDIKELNLIKVSGKIKKYKYACEKSVSDFNDLKLLNLFKNCVVKIDVAQNIVVLKTLGGNGNSAGVMVDKLNLPEIIGSVAGDDTVIIVTQTNENANLVKKELEKLL
ncbi:MAG: arginine repressor [Clostridia bacterium]|nr:arginine repressor [Clostridia bacterium]